MLQLFRSIFVLIFFLTFNCNLFANENSKHSMKHEEHMHDQSTMPGLQGKDTTEQEVNDLKTIFKNHYNISRKVVNIDNGIVTETISLNAEVREAILNHVSMMVTRMEEGRDPEVFIQSPTLSELFKYYDKIETEIEVTDYGVKLIQTSIDPVVVNLLQMHASEITDMVDRGMMAVHERMMTSNKYNN